MLSKFIIIIALLFIVYTLASSFYFMIRDKGEGKRTVRRLGWRVALSLLLFVLIFLAMAAGWVRPGSTGPIRYSEPEHETSN
jgi:cytochrome bd-type quinol oxidase subunit 2